MFTCGIPLLYSGYIRKVNLPPLQIMIFQRSQRHGDTQRDSSLIQQNQSHSVSIRQPGAESPFILEGCARDSVLFPSGASHVINPRNGNTQNKSHRGGGWQTPKINDFRSCQIKQNSLPLKNSRGKIPGVCHRKKKAHSPLTRAFIQIYQG